MNSHGLEERPLFGDPERLYRLILQGTVSETGECFFRALVHSMAEAFGTVGAWVTEYLPHDQRLRAMAMWLDGKFVENFEYPIAGTACERVVQSRSLVHIPDRLVYLFPRDTDLVPLHALSYLGAPILESDGTVLGHLSVLDNRPMPAAPVLIPVFQLFAARASAEFHRLRAEQELRTQKEQLQLLVESTLDAILVLDHELRIRRTNPAAERLFACSTEDLLGEKIEDFLADDSAERLKVIAKRGADPELGQRQWWLPENFVARRWDHSIFPAEATISRFQAGLAAFHTLILRNADERLAAERQLQLLTQETEFLRNETHGTTEPGGLIGRSDAMQRVFQSIRQVAGTDSTVLVLGETGTGKELVARAIHRASPRAAQPLVIVNCAAIPSSLLESEFFGHERGAFTGALTKREGRFSVADKGTIFLDEIGELPLEVQAKLLRVLQEGEFEPLGSARSRKVDVRVVVATHRDIQAMCTQSKFRQDLYFRLNVFPIRIPALRDRGRDVEVLAESFAQRFARRAGKSIQPLTQEQRSLLHTYDWPGNVRELQNIIERAIILTRSGELQLQSAMAGIGTPPVRTDRGLVAGSADAAASVLSAQQLLEIERENLKRALARCQGKVSGAAGAAQLVGIPPTTFTSRMKALGIARQQS